MFYWGKPQFFGVRAAAANIGHSVGNYTVEEFRQDYPQFFNSEGYFLGSLPMLEQIIQMANASIQPDKWLDSWRYAAGLYVAHYATLSLRGYADSNETPQQAAASGARRLILTPGNYGMDFLGSGALDLPPEVPIVRCSNFVGEALDSARLEGFSEILLVGHIGKFVKLAAGIFNTHSRQADGRGEIFCAHAALCGADRETARALMDSATADRCLEILQERRLQEPVLASLLGAIQVRLDRRTGEGARAGAVLFSNQYGPLGMTQGAKEILTAWKQNI